MITMGPIDAANAKTLTELRRIALESPRAYGQGLYLFLAHVLTKAMRYSPVDTGTLRQSRWLSEPGVIGTSFRAEMGFFAYYALAVHESRNKPKTGRRRFLAVALDEERSKLAGFMASATRRLIKNAPGQFTPLHPTAPLIGPQISHREIVRRRRNAGRAFADRKAHIDSHEDLIARGVSSFLNGGRRRGPVFGGMRGNT